MEDGKVKEFFDGHSVDRNSPVPLHFQLKNMIAQGISHKQLTPGDCLPTELELSQFFNISRTTVRQALTALVNEGALYRIKSKGTFISQPKIDLQYMSRIESFHSQVMGRGRIPTTKLLTREVVTCHAEIASALNIAKRDKVIHLVRLRFIDDVPIVIARSYHPVDICDQLLVRNLEEESLLDIFAEKSESTVIKVIRVIEAIGANEEDSQLLHISPGFPLQSFKSTSYNKNGRIVEYCLSLYRGDKNTFSVEISTANGDFYRTEKH